MSERRTRPRRPRKVVVLAFEGVRVMDVAAPLEVFSTAEAMNAGSYEVVICTLAGESVSSSTGLKLDAQASVSEIRSLDTLVVPGVEDPHSFLRHPDWIRAVAQLGDLAARVASPGAIWRACSASRSA